MKRKHILICVLCAALVVALSVFLWNELQKEPLDLKMYGAEISADGTVIQETEFRIKGYLREVTGDPYTPYQIYHEPITFQNIPEILITLESFQGNDLPVFYLNNTHCFLTYGENTVTYEADIPSIYLCKQMCCCIIKFENRYIVGSTEQNYDIVKILASLPEAKLSPQAS